MTTYHVDFPPLKTILLEAFIIVCFVLVSDAIDLAIEFVFWHHHVSGSGLVRFDVIFMMAFFLVQIADEEPYDLEVYDDGIRKVRDNKVIYWMPRERIRYVKERGWGFHRSLVVSKRGAFLTWLAGGLDIPTRMLEYEQIKKQVLSWVENLSAIPEPGCITKTS